MLATLCVLAIAYRFYGAFIAAKVLALDDRRPTPAHTQYDGQNFTPTNKWVLFGHHFAAITGAGPLIGPVLAAQFGWAPGLLWILAGVVLGGAVHDFIILTSSVRRGGRSLAEIARREIGPVAGAITGVAILFIVVVALAGLGIVVVNALAESAWGTFTIAVSIPLALLMGLYMYKLRPGNIGQGTAFGVVGLLAAVVFGKTIAASAVGASLFSLSKGQITFAIAAYGFIASVLPVWMLLCPRDYLSSFMKIGTIAALVLGVMWINPELKLEAVTKFAGGGGPIVPGTLFPFVFITIACGAISGFHALVGSGTTPKMVDRESHCRHIGYGSMLIEGLVGVTSLVAAASLYPGDYFAINVPPGKFAELGMHTVELPALSAAVGETLVGRTGGSVSLAVGMAQIFSGIPGMKHLFDYWYHFAIMFEALFILTTIDTGTRVARFLVQELFGKLWRPFARTDWVPGSLVSTGAVVLAWAWFLHTGSIATIWPMFGIANQLLAATALCVGTSVIVNSGRGRYAWVTILPLCFVATTTMVAGYQSIRDNFLPLALDPSKGKVVQGWIDTIVTIVLMGCAVTVIGDSARKWLRAAASGAAGGSGIGGAAHVQEHVQR